MTTTTEARLAGPLQALVDSRLETIERMLMGHLPRQERLAIVREVETQIFELLQERERPGEELTREDVLAVLARLDPPEAYLPEMPEGAEWGQRRTVPTSRPIPMPRKAQARTAKASGILGLVVLALFLLNIMSWTAAVLIQSPLLGGLAEISALASFLPVIMGGTLSITLAFVSRLKGAWSIVGLATSGFSLVCLFLAVLWVVAASLG